MVGSAARETQNQQQSAAAPAPLQAETPAAGSAPPTPTAPAVPVHLLTEEERRVLAAFGDRALLTLGQLRAGTSMEVAQLRPILQSLRRRGLLRQLNTVVESYCSRADYTPGRKAGTATARQTTR